MNNRRKNNDTVGVITLIQMLLVICLIAGVIMLPAFSQTEYLKMSAFLNENLMLETGENEIQSIRNLFETKIYASEQIEKKAPPAGNSFAPFLLIGHRNNPLKSFKITDTFGFRNHPIKNTVDFHTGVDLAAEKDADVYSSICGRVSYVTNSDAVYGNYLIVENNNIKTFYAHCNQIVVKEGEWVNAGQIIAKVGNTGLSTGYHLHYEIAVGGVRANPLSYIER